MSVLKEGTRATARAFTIAITAIVKLAVNSIKYPVGLFAHHFDWIAERSIGRRVLTKQKSSFNLPLQLLLFPIILTSWILAATIVPVLYHSFLSIINTLITVARLAFLDLPENDRFFKKRTLFDKPLYLVPYAIPGMLLGFGLGAVAAIIFTIGRAIRHSNSTFWSTAWKVTRLALEDKNAESPLGKDERTSIYQKYILGFPGLLVGAILGAVSFAIAGTMRCIKHSLLTTRYLAGAITDARIENGNLHINSKDNRTSNLQKYLMGFPGVILGSILGVVGFSGRQAVNVITNSAKTAWVIWATIVNHAGLYDLAKYTTGGRHLLDNQDARTSFLKKYVLGFLGIPVGVAAGIAGFTIIWAWEIIKHSFITTVDTAEKMPGVAMKLGKLNQVNDKDDLPPPPTAHPNPRSFVQKNIIGFPGRLIGLGVGLALFTIIVSIRIIHHTAKTAYHIFGEISIKAAGDNLKKVEVFGHDKRHHLLEKYALGFPGIVVGITTGIIGFACVGTGRIVKHTAMTAYFLFATMTAIPIANIEFKAKFGKDKRTSNFDKYALGFPGLVIGASIGAIGFLIAGIVHSSTYSITSARNSFWFLTNLALEKENRKKLPAQNRRMIEHVFGLPGLIVGSLSGVVAISAVLSFRVIKNSIKTTKHLFIRISLKGIPPEFREPAENDPGTKDQRTSFTEKYVFGFPGVILGCITGAAGYVGLAISLNSYTSFKYTLKQALMLSNIDEAPFHRIPDNRSENSKIFGIPGVLLAMPVAISIITFTFGYKILRESGPSLVRTLKYAYNLAYFDLGAEKKYTIIPDDRNYFKKFLGIPGLVVGIGIGSLLFTCHIFIRTAINIGISTKQYYKRVTYNALDPNHPPLAEDRRTGFELVLGSAGILLGTMAGVVGVIIFRIGYFIQDNARSGLRAFNSAINLSLEPPKRSPNLSNDPRTTLAKAFSFIGYIVGGTFGITGATVILTLKVIKHSSLSWFHVSGSLLNLALEVPYFKGISNDKRPLKHQILGGLGYALAFATTGIMTVAIITTKYIVIFCTLCLGLVTSIFVAPIKAFAIHNNPRFKPEPDNDETNQKFKNIYSSLNGFGQLNEGKDIPINQSGGKGVLCFIRKSVTFDISSLTERTLDECLKGYRESANKTAFFTDNSIPTILDNIKKYYKSLDSVLQTSEEVIQREKQIDDIGQFVVDYMQGNTKKPSERLYKNSTFSFKTCFFSNKNPSEQARTADANQRQFYG